MSDLHELCKFGTRPITKEIYLDNLARFLKSGIPSTYTIEEALLFAKETAEAERKAAKNDGEAVGPAAEGSDESGKAEEENGSESDEPVTTTTPLHLICTHVPRDMTVQEGVVVGNMIDLLFEYGAGWCLIDVNNETPGCILIRRCLKYSTMYEQILAAGVRAELLLRKVSEYDVEIIENTDDVDHSQFHSDGEAPQEAPQEAPKEAPKEALPENAKGKAHAAAKKPVAKRETLIDNGIDEPDAPSHNNEAFLNSRLQYLKDSLVTKDRRDGVMMSWEHELMQQGCDSLFRGAKISRDEVDDDVVILNIGFGMGIIDTMIQEQKPQKHYICEAHPDVLAKMRADGWFEKENVVVLSGRWQDELDKILSLGKIFFNGIYYDTFSEQYEDMLQLYDYVVGLLKPHGVFSFFNGLGADREVVYDVYKSLVELDLEDYGLQCAFEELKIPPCTFDPLGKANKDANGVTIWDDVKRPYWLCPVYYHPQATFLD